ncbi:MAG TPA: acyloxyacyl hydrolase [Gammaproteobacteria bacterium]|jgi:hypothetical protein
MNANGKIPSRLAAVTAAALITLAPAVVHADTYLSAGYTGMHDGGRGRALMVDWVPAGSPWDYTIGNIGGVGQDDRDTSFVAASYMIVDQHLFASFGPALITKQTETLTSAYQFMTTFGYHTGDWALGVRHLSNGGLKGANIGENLVFLSYHF